MATRVFFATDVHGSERCFRKFVNAGKFYKADVLILGGDLTGKMIVPIIRVSEDRFQCDFFEKSSTLRTPEELEELKKRIVNSGYYFYVLTAEEKEKLSSSPEQKNELFASLMRDRLKQWIELAEERLRPTGIRCYMTGGNDDPWDINAILRSSDYVVDPEDQVVQIDEHHEMISSSLSNLTPWRCPRDVSEEEMRGKIEEVASRIQNMEKCIFNLHCPPNDTGIDTAIEIDESLRPVGLGGQFHEVPVGSEAVRVCIERYQPLLGLHGHIHESRGAFRIGRTLCLNPGSEYSEGILRGVIIDLDKKGIKNYQFISG